VTSLYFFSLIPLLAAAIIGITGPKPADVAAIQFIFFPIVVFLAALLIGYIFRINSIKVLAFTGMASIAFVVWALLSSGKKRPPPPKGKT
jgi:hypothetical protein